MIHAALAIALLAASPAPHGRVIHPGDMNFSATYKSTTVSTGCPHGRHWVAGYKRKDGTLVKGYCR